MRMFDWLKRCECGAECHVRARDRTSRRSTSPRAIKSNECIYC
jgi:hypothetical protein